MKVLSMATKFKKVMKDEHLKFAKAKCQICDGFLHGKLIGPKQHFHMYCDGTCKSYMME